MSLCPLLLQLPRCCCCPAVVPAAVAPITADAAAADQCTRRRIRRLYTRLRTPSPHGRQRRLCWLEAPIRSAQAVDAGGGPARYIVCLMQKSIKNIQVYTLYALQGEFTARRFARLQVMMADTRAHGTMETRPMN